MKPKIAKSLLVPLLYGLLAGWIGVGIVTETVLYKLTAADLVQQVMALSAILLLALFPALRRGAWAYSNARKYHSAEYFYDLGNGMDHSKAVATYEKKVHKAMGAWVKRKFVKNSFGVIPVGYCLVVLPGGGLLESLLYVAIVTCAVYAAIMVGKYVMLFSARKLCYDKYGNLKNN